MGGFPSAVRGWHMWWARIPLVSAVCPTMIDASNFALATSFKRAGVRPFSIPDAGTQQMSAALQKYAHLSKTQFPTLFQYETWAGADLMIKGPRMAGPDPSRAAVIKNLRRIKAYDANGLLPNPIDNATVFGHDPPQQCVWVLQACMSGFVPVSTKPICGADLWGTSTVSSPSG